MLIGDPLTVSGATSIEGLPRAPGGQVISADYFDGTLRVLDVELQRTPEADLSYSVGHGVSFPLGLTYREDTAAFVVEHVTLAGPRFVATGFDFETFTPQFVLEPDSTNESSLTWLLGLPTKRSMACYGSEVTRCGWWTPWAWL